VGGAGYNTVRECLAWEVPLIARAWPRTYDRQEMRAGIAAGLGRVTLVVTPEEAARRALEQREAGPPRAPRFRNGAEDAARRISAMEASA
jgi:predicted glycosyltransferase